MSFLMDFNFYGFTQEHPMEISAQPNKDLFAALKRSKAKQVQKKQNLSTW